jgi:hypothetical protein
MRTHRTKLAAVAAIGLVTAMGHDTAADGCFMPDAATFRKQRERALIHEPEQKAAIIFRDGVEDLIISPRFSGPASRFAWVIPTPSRPTIGKVAGALFHELAALVYRPAPASYEGRAMGGAKAARVTVLERKQVGAYDVAVLQAGDSGALMRWLAGNGFAMVPAAEKPIRAHVAENWTFVAARVNVPQAATGLSDGTLAPIRLTFRTQRPVYPLRVSSANPAAFLVNVYFITQWRETDRPFLAVVRGPRLSDRGVTATSFVGDPARRAPTLARLARGNVAVYHHARRYEPGECVGDLTFELAREMRGGPRPIR